MKMYTRFLTFNTTASFLGSVDGDQIGTHANSSSTFLLQHHVVKKDKIIYM